MRRKLIIFIALIAGMGGLFIAQETRSNHLATTKDQAEIALELDSLLTALQDLSGNGEFERVIDEVDVAEEALLGNPQDSFYLSAYRQLRGNAFYALGEYDKAIEGLNEAIAATTNTETGLKQRATQLFDRANAEYQLDMMADCYRSTLASEAILTQLEHPDYDYLISVYNDLAYQSRALAFYDDARKFLAKARSVYNSKKDIVDSYEIPVRKPVSFAYSEVLINAEDQQEEKMLVALEELEELTNSKITTKQEKVRLSSAYNAVADYYISDLHQFSSEKLEKAKRYLTLTKNTLDPELNHGGVDQWKFNEAKMAYNIGEYAKAKSKFDQLTFELAEGDLRRPFFVMMQGLVDLKLNNQNEAEEYFFHALEVTHSGSDSLLRDCSNYVPSTNIIHATLFSEIADTIKLYDEQLFEQIGTKLQVAGMKEFEANYQGKTFNARLKRTYEALFQGLLEPVLSEQDHSKQQKLYADLLDRSETIENRLLWSKFLLNRRLGQLDVPDSIRRKEQIMRLNIVQARKAGDAQTCFELENELEKFERSILKNYPKYGTFSQGAFDVKSLQKSISNETLIIKFAELNGECYRFIVTKKQIACEKLARVDILKDEVETYLDLIEQRGQDRHLAKLLRQKLLPTNYDSFSKIVCVNNLMFGELPFEALCNDQLNYLVEDVQITYAPHLVFIQSEGEGDVGNGEVVVFTPVYSNGPTNLNGAKGESELIAQNFESKYFHQKKATRSAFLDVSTNASVLHLSMHAEINEEIGEQSCFLFSNEKLYLDELYGLNLSGQMAVLSACNTGRSFKDVRSGNASLQRAFMYAGITSTLSSLWEIPDQSTQKIMASFYESLKSGLTNGEAIQAAKRSFLENADDPHLQSPYFWAGFVLSGKDQIIELNTSGHDSGYWMWITISVLVVFGATFWIFYRGKKRA